MNLTISKEQIINGLQAVQNVVSTRTTLPILSNVLLRAEGERLEFTATDLDVTISSAVEAKVKKPGASTVPVKKLFGIVRELSNSEIDLEVDERTQPFASGQRRGGNALCRKPGFIHVKRRKRVFDFDCDQADRGKLSELPPGNSWRDQRAGSTGARGVPARFAPGRDHDQREIQFGQAEFWQKQAGNYRECAGGGRGQRKPGSEL